MSWCMHVEELGCMTCLFFCTVGVQLASNILQCPICHSTPELNTNFQQKSDMFTVMGEKYKCYVHNNFYKFLQYLK